MRPTAEEIEEAKTEVEGIAREYERLVREGGRLAILQRAFKSEVADVKRKPETRS